MTTNVQFDALCQFAQRRGKRKADGQLSGRLYVQYLAPALRLSDHGKRNVRQSSAVGSK
jgi:hypothetical protein